MSLKYFYINLIDIIFRCIRYISNSGVDISISCLTTQFENLYYRYGVIIEVPVKICAIWRKHYAL